MGNVKVYPRDGQIVFHVGKELPPVGGRFLLVPGKQSAQGRGVYAEDVPNLSYAGGEHYRTILERTPVFCLPMQGNWARAVMKKKNDKVVYHSAGGLLLMENLVAVDGEYQGRPVRWYASSEITRIQEPPGQELQGSMLEELRSGRQTQEAVLAWLDEMGMPRSRMNGEKILAKLAERVSERVVPSDLLRRMRGEHAEVEREHREGRRST